MRAIFSLLSNIIITGTSIIGCTTIINKLGKFFKTMEEETKEDSFKIAFDNLMIDTIDDMNKCVESISVIASNFNNVSIIIYDIIVGNKFIKKDKDGKIIICTKAKLYSGYKDKIDELSNKVKKYQDELRKIKKKNTNNNNKSDNNDSNSDTDSDNDDSTISSDSSNSSNDSSSVSDFTLDGNNSVSTNKTE
jgi:hypothetical protein